MHPTKIRSRAVTVIGAGRSGMGAARLLNDAGAKVFLTEQGPAKASQTDELAAMGIAFEFGGHTGRARAADFFVISPGVPSTIDLVKFAHRTGRAVYSEIEVASWFCPAPIVAVTGSNGKTTTSSLLGYIFKKAGRKTMVAGNVGLAFSNCVSEVDPDDVVVLEVSSFQLDHIDTFRPHVAVLLNITPDHLDRYEQDFERYAQSKLRICENLQDQDVLVYNMDDEVTRCRVAEIVERRAVRTLGFSLNKESDQGAFVKGGALVLRINQCEEVLMQVEHLSLRGQHNLSNSLAAAVAARVMEVRSDVVRESLATFEGVPHRLEFVRELDGIRYVNDSKATNVNSVWYALESIDEPIVLIVGGRDKGNDYGPLRPLVRRKVRAVVAIGESADKVIAELGDEVLQKAKASTMEEALRLSRIFAHSNDVVLLSPACASFDMFQNYEDRGDTFKRLVASL